jgi:hypothetical protein
MAAIRLFMPLRSPIGAKSSTWIGCLQKLNLRLMTNRHEQEEAARRQAMRDLGGLEREGDLLGRSGVGRMAKRAADHFAAADARQENDAIELWGRRIGRVLSAVGFVALAAYLYWTYVR